jgi:mycofactocin precursor
MTSTVTETHSTLDAPVDDTVADGAGDENVLSELLVEEISIDGMCGVY